MNNYISPFSLRYASKEMSTLFSPTFKFSTWRRLWICLAEGEKELGLPITQAQIDQLKAKETSIDYARAEELEKVLHHDVMAHIHAYGEQCPEAKGIIHLGATSCFVTDNTDLIQMKEGLSLLLLKLKCVIKELAAFAQKHAALPCLSYTHFQAAQPTTVGKRACLWLQDLLTDYLAIERVMTEIRFLGLKGATGTQSSFLQLFAGDHAKVVELEQKIAKKLGFSKLFTIAGQTYTRKQDITILAALTSFAASTHKFATDLRLLAHLKEIEEPFASSQVGSSAMPHKRNPIYAERICAISRFLMSLQENALYTEATQWLERSLDDSANRRLYIPESFLAADSLLNLLLKVIKDLHVNPKKIRLNLEKELPFLLTEQILMAAVQKGKDRQHVHERLRSHSVLASQKVQEGEPSDLLDKIAQDKEVGLSMQDLQHLIETSSLTGRAEQQVITFLKDEVHKIL